jgi:adenylate cyclase
VASEGTEHRLAAVLVADVVGYSRLMAEDQDATVRTVTAYREEVELLVRQHRGRLVDFTGDEFLAEFSTALESVRCAVEIQRVLSARNEDLPSDRRMQFRMGVHLGDVAAEGERLYGDGVNIAARLQALADPGGVCVSGSVHDLVHTKLGVGFDDLGTKSVKNIPDPVRVYRVEIGAETAAGDLPVPGMDELTVPGFGGRPAIAVLPFDNLSGDPEQEYFADGLAEDLITRLSAWRDVPVIARNSSFVYKGRSVDVKQVGRELGMRYVVEGSVRRAGGRVRVAAQLIDATTGAHVWAERYDRDLRDLFELQDEITESIDGALRPELFRAERERIARREVPDPDAYDRLQRGLWHLSRVTREDTARARELFEEAIRLEPRMVEAPASIAFAHHLDIANGWTDSRERSLAEMTRAAQQAIAADPEHYAGHLVLGIAFRNAGQLERARTAVELAIRLNPSSAQAYSELGVLTMFERPEEAIPLLEKAMRLSPQDPMVSITLFRVGVSRALEGRHEEAVEWIQRSIDRGAFPISLQYAFLAASCSELGRPEEARAAVEQALRIQPDLSIATFRRAFPLGREGIMPRAADALRKAGFPEE